MKEATAGRAVLGPDGVYETAEEGAESAGDQPEPVDGELLRKEIQEWGRIVQKPIQRKGYIEMDTCTPEGLPSFLSFSSSLLFGQLIFLECFS